MWGTYQICKSDFWNTSNDHQLTMLLYERNYSSSSSSSSSNSSSSSSSSSHCRRRRRCWCCCYNDTGNNITIWKLQRRSHNDSQWLHAGNVFLWDVILLDVFVCPFRYCFLYVFRIIGWWSIRSADLSLPVVFVTVSLRTVTKLQSLFILIFKPSLMITFCPHPQFPFRC